MICDTNSTHFLVREGNYWRSVLKESDEGKQIAIDLAAQAEVQERLRRKANLNRIQAELGRRKKKLARAQRKFERAQAEYAKAVAWDLMPHADVADVECFEHHETGDWRQDEAAARAHFDVDWCAAP